MSNFYDSLTFGRPVKSRFWQRFKDRQWRLFGTKPPPGAREAIVARWELRKLEWFSRRFGGMLGQVMRRHQKELTKNIVEDFILLRCLGDKEMQPMVFKIGVKSDD